MSEDAIRVELQGLREDGRRRGDKIDEVLRETTKIDKRVDRLKGVVDLHTEKLNSHDVKIDNLEKRIYQIGFLLLVLHGSAREVLAIFS